MLWQRNITELRHMKCAVGKLLILTFVGGSWYYIVENIHGTIFFETLGVHNFLRATVSEHPKDNVGGTIILLCLSLVFFHGFSHCPQL